jgi:hypothetical protein
MELPEPERVVPGTAPKKPDDSDEDPMTGAPASCLKTLSEEFGESGRRRSGSTRSRRKARPAQ